MPSANLSGRPSSTTYKHVEADFGEKFPVVDGGACQAGLESTILLIGEEVKILREGILTQNDFIPVLGFAPQIFRGGAKPLCPGQMFRHYSPKAELVLTKELPKSGTIVGFSDRSYPNLKVYSLGSFHQSEQIAHNLYATLRRLDEDGIKMAFVDFNFPDNSLFATIKERLIKAAGKK
jgi:L-threonylcarbamoyladenylate synthase